MSIFEDMYIQRLTPEDVTDDSRYSICKLLAKSCLNDLSVHFHLANIMAFENPDSTVKALKETTKDPESAAYVMRQSGYDDLLAFAKVDFVNLEDCVDLGSNGFERSLNSVKARLASQSLKAIRISQYGINPNVSGFDQAFFSGVAWAASEDFPTAEHLAVYVDEADRNMSNRVERFNPFSVPTIGKDVTGRVGSAKRYRHYELTDIPGRQYH